MAAHSFLPEPAHIAGRDQIASSRIAVLLDTVSKRKFCYMSCEIGNRSGSDYVFDLAAVAIIYWNIEAAVAHLVFK